MTTAAYKLLAHVLVRLVHIIRFINHQLGSRPPVGPVMPARITIYTSAEPKRAESSR